MVTNLRRQPRKLSERKDRTRFTGRFSATGAAVQRAKRVRMGTARR